MIKEYLRHLVTAKTVRSLHSPFVFELYTNIIRSSATYDEFLAIENIRKSLLNNHQIIAIKDLGAGSRKTSNNERKISKIARHSVSNRKTSQLLFKLIRQFRPNTVVELGTSLGINTLYLAQAHPQAHLVTLEGCPNIAAIAQQNFSKGNCPHIHLAEGNIDYTLPVVLETLPLLDFVFFDANHRYAPTLQYFELCLAQAHEHSIFVFDDIYWSAEMQQAWQEIRQHPEVTLSIDLFRVGLVFFRKDQPVQHFRLQF